MDIATLYGKLAAPARRALEALNLRTVEELAGRSREELAALHGIGPGALRTIEAELEAQGLALSRRGPGSPSPVEAYILSFPSPCRERLRDLRRIIRSVAPEAEEGFAYRMPSYKLGGPLVYFAGYAAHVGLYPTPSAIEAFKDELAPFKSAKGSVQFPLDRPLPEDLIRRIVEFRVAENRGRG